MPEDELLIEYDEYNIPDQKAKEILSAPDEYEEYFPNPYKYFFRDAEIPQELFYELKKELKNPDLLKKQLKKQDEVIDEIMQNSNIYDEEWDLFLENLSYHMQERNDKGYWETPCTIDKHDCNITNKADETGSRLLGCDNGKELLDEIIDYDVVSKYGSTAIHIFNYKKKGFLVKASHHDDILLLPACRSGFIRDWEHDGICIEEVEED
jgi:hypothetical protein